MAIMRCNPDENMKQPGQSWSDKGASTSVTKVGSTTRLLIHDGDNSPSRHAPCLRNARRMCGPVASEAVSGKAPPREEVVPNPGWGSGSSDSRRVRGTWWGAVR